MRKLKTSNARRDLPLGVLIPEDELRLVKHRVARIRGKAEEALRVQAAGEVAANKKKKEDRTWRDGLLFPTAKDPFRAVDFETIVGRVHESIRVPKQDFPGDTDFHYHILRHSAANLLLLKLWPALHPVARRILHRHPETLREIRGSEAFRRRLFGTDRLRGSDLQAIALLLGHGSSATSLEHYLHVLDWYRLGGTEAVAELEQES
jgi:integrase